MDVRHRGRVKVVIHSDRRYGVSLALLVSRRRLVRRHGQADQVHSYPLVLFRQHDHGARVNHLPMHLDNHHRHFRRTVSGRNAQSILLVANAAVDQVSR